jgi:hypothetical protein
VGLDKPPQAPAVAPVPEEGQPIFEAVAANLWHMGLGPGQQIETGMEQPARRILWASRCSKRVQGGRSGGSVGQEDGYARPPGGGVLGKRAAPAPDGPGRWLVVQGHALERFQPGCAEFKTRDEHLADDSQEVMPEAEQEAGQDRSGAAAGLTQPALDADLKDLLLIQRLAHVEAVTDERSGVATARATIRAGKDQPVEVRDVDVVIGQSSESRLS